MFLKLKIIFFFITLVVSLSNASRSFSSCCSKGQSKYSSSNPSSCSDFSSLSDKSSSCKYAFTICCAQSRRNDQCQRGKKHALASLPCSDLNNELTECCNCCELGVESGKNGDECNPPSELSPECKNSYLECCKQQSKPNDCSSHSCSDNQVCEDTRSGPQCKCQNGFEKDQRSNGCVKVDDCKRSNRCPTPSPCGPKCPQRSCSSGFSFDAIFTTCRDVNECSSGTHTCGSGTKCENLPGSFTCIKIKSCGSGFTVNQNTQQCEDIDECESKPNSCGSKDACVNTRGSFKCVKIECPSGYKPVNDGTPRCDKIPNSCRPQEPECPKKPTKIFYSYTSISYNYQVPIRIFTTRVNINTRSNLRYEFKLINSQGVSLREDQFMVKQTNSNTFDVFLLEHCKASESFQVELKIDFYSNSQFTSCVLNKIQVFITE